MVAWGFSVEGGRKRVTWVVWRRNEERERVALGEEHWQFGWCFTGQMRGNRGAEAMVEVKTARAFPVGFWTGRRDR